MLSTFLLILAQSNPVTGGQFETFATYTTGETGDTFGSAVAGVGDLDGDGLDDFLIGAPTANVASMANAGAAYLISSADGSVIHKFEGTHMFQNFGARVAAMGDVDGDQFLDFAIGAPNSNEGGASGSGSAWIYSGRDLSVVHEFHGSVQGQRLGYTLADLGDLNADGNADFAIASVPPAGFTSHKTNIAVYSGANGILLHDWVDPTSGNTRYGRAVTSVGDMDGDGTPDWMTSAPDLFLLGATNGGKVWVHSGATGNILLEIRGWQDYQAFGSSLSRGDDFDGDGVPDLWIGAPGADPPNNLTKEGAVYLCSGATGDVLHAISGRDDYSSTGAQVVQFGDINLDGYADVAIASPSAAHEVLHIYSSADGVRLRSETGGYQALAAAGDANGDQRAELLVGASLYGLDPFLRVGTDEISAAHGGNVVLAVEFPAGAAGWPYKTLLSASGTGPIQLEADIPLTLDSYTVDSFHNLYPGNHYFRLHGQLDADAKALASIAFGKHLPQSLVGSTFWMAVMVSEPGSQLPHYCSAAQPICIVP